MKDIPRLAVDVWRAATKGRRKFLLVGIATFALFLSLGLWRADVYLTRSESFCLSCHDGAQSDLANSSHASLDCSACHRSSFGQNALLFGKKLTEGTKANSWS